ncbi:hypothetical protein CLD22_12070 [Rubrivivax gelatinosus]|nr:hypothetical protein [Rubrivivax gelatinosus]
MWVNLALLAGGAWGLHHTWTRRQQSGGSLFFDMASSVRNPWAYRFAVAVRLLIFGLCAAVGGYRLVFGLVD